MDFPVLAFQHWIGTVNVREYARRPDGPETAAGATKVTGEVVRGAGQPSLHRTKTARKGAVCDNFEFRT